jgi:hypothetical protein
MVLPIELEGWEKVVRATSGVVWEETRGGDPSAELGKEKKQLCEVLGDKLFHPELALWGSKEHKECWPVSEEPSVFHKVGVVDRKQMPWEGFGSGASNVDKGLRTLSWGGFEVGSDHPSCLL